MSGFGVIHLVIYRAEGLKLDQKEQYLVQIDLEGTAFTKGAVRTKKAPPSAMEWNAAQDVTLAGNLLSGTELSGALVQVNTLRPDSKVGKFSITLDPLTRGEGIDEEFVVKGNNGEDVARVAVRASWKDLPANLAGGGGAHGDHADGVMSLVSAAPQPAGVATPPPIKLPVPTGNSYSLRVRFHKAKGLLSPKDDKVYKAMGTVSCLGKTERTAVADESNDPIFDEEVTLTFDKVKENFWTEGILITLLNHRTGLPNQTIGSVQMDSGSIYRSNPKHFLKGKWLVLHRSVSEGNVMGYLKLSISLINLRTDSHPEIEEGADDEDESEESIIANLMSGPGSVYEELYLHCELVKAEGIPKMDLGGTADPYVKLRFGTKEVQTANIRNTLTPTWNASVVLPMMMPSLTNALTIQMWDYDKASADDLIGTETIDLSGKEEVKKARRMERKVAGKVKDDLSVSVSQRLQQKQKERQREESEYQVDDDDDTDDLPRVDARWLNFYGHPRGEDADFNRYYKAMARGEKKGIDYRGRLLLRITGARSDKPPPLPEIKQGMVEVKIVAQLLLFSMIPASGTYKVRVSCGTTGVVTQPAKAQEMRGKCGMYYIYFGQQVEFTAKFQVVLPPEGTDAKIAESFVADQVPEVIFQLVQESFTVFSSEETLPYASTRFPVEKLLNTTFYKCKSMRLSIDSDKMKEGEYPANPMAQFKAGAMFISCSEPIIQVSRTISTWTEVPTAQPDTYILDCHLFQARQVPAGDDNGLSDPFVRITWANASVKSGIQKETLNPTFNELLRVNAQAHQVPFVGDEGNNFPDVVVELWDWDFIGKNTFLCKSVITWGNVMKCITAQRSEEPYPFWYGHFTDTFGGKVPGCEVLLSFAFRKDTGNIPLPKEREFFEKVGSDKKYKGYALPKELSLSPYYIHGDILGLRSMRKFRLRELQEPHIEFDVGGKMFRTKKETGPNPNYNMSVEMLTQLPTNPKYFPQLNIRVYDTRLRMKTMVGGAILPLTNAIFDAKAKEEAKKNKTVERDELLNMMKEVKMVMARSEDGQQVDITRLSRASRGASLATRPTSLPGKTADPSSPKRKIGDPMQQPLLDGQDDPSSPAKNYAATVDMTAVAEAEDVIHQQLDITAELKALKGDDDSSITSDDGDDLEWFDRYDPQNSSKDVAPSDAVMRFQKLKPMLDELYDQDMGTAMEALYGPFDDDFTHVELKRGWGRKAQRAGIALFDMSVEPAPAGLRLEPDVASLKPSKARAKVDFVCRVYIIACTGLAAMDHSVLGHASDPYVILRLTGGGSSKEDVVIKCNAEGEAKFQTLNPEYFFSKDMRGNMPAHTMLKITVMDYDKIGSDEEIGTTEISLEDRWYSSRGYNQGKPPLHLTPGMYTEKRQLRDSKGMSQGSIELWVDLFPATSVPPALKITPPPPIPLELRAVVWNTRDVVLTDTSFIGGEEMTDIYVRCFMEGMQHDMQNTDVHYRSLDGTGNFNWRMVFSFVLDPRTRKLLPGADNKGMFSKLKKLFSVRKEQKKLQPEMHVQLYDNDLLPGSDDFIGEVSVNLLRLKPTRSRRNQETFLQMLTGDVVGCCGLGCCDCCCPRKKQDKLLTLEERRQIAIDEAKRDLEEDRKYFEEIVGKKMEVLKHSPEYKDKPTELEALKKSLVKQARKEARVNVFAEYLPSKKKKQENKIASKLGEEENKNPDTTETAKFWFPCRGPFGGTRVGDVQLSFQVCRTEAIEKDEAMQVGKGRSDPQALPEPKRPDSSFFWLSSPWKAAVHILWKNYKWYIISFVCIVLLAVFLYFFLTEGIKVKAEHVFT